jgi:hypothetical protein
MEYCITGYCSIRNSGVIADDLLEHFEEKFVTFADFIKSLYKKEGVSYPKFFKMDGLSKLGFLTAELLLKRREMDRYRKERVGLVLSNSSSSLDTDLVYTETIRDRANYFPSPSVFVYTLPNIMNGEICIRHKFRGENTFLLFYIRPSGKRWTTTVQMSASAGGSSCCATVTNRFCSWSSAKKIWLRRPF